MAGPVAPPPGPGSQPVPPRWSRDRSGLWLRNAAAGLCVLAAAAAAVSFTAQYRMVDATRHLPVVAALEAAIPDAAALVFACLGIALALHGRRALRARALNLASVAASVFMNAIAAAPGWRNLAIWAMPPVAYALASDTLITVVRSPPPAAGRWPTRPPRWPSSAAWSCGCCAWPWRRPRPWPGSAPGCSRNARSPPAAAPRLASLPAARPGPGGGTVPRKATKTARFLSLVAERHGPLASIPLDRVARISAALAPVVGLNPGAARAALRKAVLAARNGDPSMILKYVIALAVLIVLAAVFAWAFLPARHLPGNRARHLRIRLHLRLHPGKGFAHLFSLWLRWGRFAALRRSGRIRALAPAAGTGSPDPAEHSVFLGRAHYRHGLRVPLEEHLLVMAPPRTYKTAFLADVILRYPGPVIATTTKADMYQLTAAVRAEQGPVHVFNPQHIGGVAVHLLLGPGRRLRGPGHRDPPRRRVRVRRVPERRRGRHVLVRQGQRLPARLLPRRRPGPLRPARRRRLGGRRRPRRPRADPGRRRRPPVGAARWPNCAPRPTRPPPQSGWSCPGRWRSWPTPPWPPACCPAPATGSTSPPSSTAPGTVYLIAEAVSEDAPVAPLFAAMATEIHWIAAQIGQASPSGRLDPPLLMGLDEVTQICPVPLPSWLSDSGGKGIQVIAVVHGEAQLAERWGDYGRQVVLDTSSVKVFLPGITDVTTLQAASTLCGQASWKVRGQDHATRHDVATPDMIRQLPAGFALVIRGGCAPVIARLPRAWKNPAYRRARRLGLDRVDRHRRAACPRGGARAGPA